MYIIEVTLRQWGVVYLKDYTHLLEYILYRCLSLKMSATLRMSAFVKKVTGSNLDLFFQVFLYICNRNTLLLWSKTNFCNLVSHTPLFPSSQQVAAHNIMGVFFIQSLHLTANFHLTLHLYYFLVDLGGNNLRIVA